jgi:hypothetical protein
MAGLSSAKRRVQFAPGQRAYAKAMTEASLLVNCTQP